ncbi:ABC transporter ATP-binding protein [Thermus sp.]|uniref:ABC transporter ATP-binding protein n=1 Tax=Thermus sp. TaxID=275 RepID=UPI0025CC6B8C|nr:ABC transporter ATP-binding protein [Thermus sp.]MCS6868663.1 ABC transporter ATP-binding protein [Thermus sp.]MDW8357047.1 ABC transporter ATP-binding protein [Thermus sp.]
MLLRLQALSKRFGRDWVIRDLSFTLERGEVVALLGPNGSGKTTLLRLMAGLLKPTQGRVERGGRPLFLANPPAFHRHLTAGEHLRYDLLFHGFHGQEGDWRGALARFGLPENLPLAAFSSGMRKRLALARLSLLKPDIWLLDEPETALDGEGRGLLLEVLAEARGQGGVVLATHDRALAEGVADRTLELGAA